MRRQRWKLGSITISTVPEIEVEFDGGKPSSIVPQATPQALGCVPWLFPNYATVEGRLKVAIHAIVIDTGSERILVDPCVGNGRVRRSPVYHMLDTPFLDELQAVGYTRDEITCVINTHLHMDHVGWNTMRRGDAWVPTFPNARYILPGDDFEYYKNNADDDRRTMLADSVLPIVEAGLAKFFHGQTHVTQEVALTATPGHSPGHASVIVSAGAQRAVITGDVLHSPSQITHPEWSSGFDVDQDAARATRAAFLREYADSQALIVGTHFPAPSAGRILSEGPRYRFEPIAGT